MLLMSVNNLSRAYDRGQLFDEVSFEVFHGDRIGLVGPNGAGKTTLMRILSGQDSPDSGDVRFHAGAEAVILDQVAEFAPGRTLFAEAQSAFAKLLKAQEELVRVAEKMSGVNDPQEQKVLEARYERLNEQLHHNDAYALDHKVETVLGGLGFNTVDYNRDVRTFSGGQQRRLLLAKLLLASPDIMLLDEPSNHLDIDTTRWLEDYLSQQQQAMIVVSHDRYFLNKVVNKIFELHNRKITSYPGNFQQYMRLREETYERQLKEFEAQKEYIEKEEEYIRRIHYGQMARTAQSRMKKLDKIERFEAPTKITAPDMRFGPVVRAGDIIFQVENVGKAFGEKRLFTDLSFDLQRGKRLGIMGPNGCGKTTLLKILLGEEKPTEGRVKKGALTELGYLDQHLKLLDENKSIMQAAWPEGDPSMTEQKMRDLLGRFGLSGRIIEQPVRECSGGEKSRTAMARLVVLGANVLILDEPTNHLDIWACEALEEAVLAFEGTVIVVSHDRYFLNRVSDILLVMEPGRVEVVYGNYDTYELLRANREAAAKEEAERKVAREAAKNKPAAVNNANPAKPTKKKRKFPYRKVEELEAEILELEIRSAEIETALNSADLYRDANRMKETLQDAEDTKVQLQRLYEHLEEAMELN
ncbi:ABC-F family ATP-binding cassette domain-containing protein [Telmatocola sphagniphila]|uniref:ABC-F family ATP-binding cassette domain-containing protein n=1 Tax=Telmatocola sphagniphila TaxID=1123043 RepID=A0A8E6B2L6_9BACT|nr:ABC-F family ATP-binding cassette domain-containing protein [Telmatocola sphagniphila]QVL30687.1 ABC-F family ATP-binding cassette domain-containing protein [Telmatocola sphagniphila]